MAIVVEISKKGTPVFKSAKGFDISSEEIEKATVLDELVKKEIIQLSGRLKNSKEKNLSSMKDKSPTYWEFGSVIRKIYESKVDPSEKTLFWKTIELRAPKELLAKNRGPNRIHVEYCFRLAGYPKKEASKMKWSEWVYVFDSPAINRETRFDKWFKLKMQDESELLKRKNVRLFVQCLNTMLGGAETADLSDDELYRCYNAAWEVSKRIIEKNMDKNKIKENLENLMKNRNDVGELIMESISVKDFVKRTVKN